MLLHHFLGEDDLKWLKTFESFELNDTQKQALLFVREVGAIDNLTYRQMADCDTLKASADLRELKDQALLTSKGKGKATYYIAGSMLVNIVSAHGDTVSAHGNVLSAHGEVLSAHGDVLSAHGDIDTKENLLKELPNLLRDKVSGIKLRENNPEILNGIIKELCTLRAYKLIEIATLLDKRENYIRRKFLLPLIKNKEMRYLYPEMIKHPNQAYRTIEKN